MRPRGVSSRPDCSNCSKAAMRSSRSEFDEVGTGRRPETSSSAGRKGSRSASSASGQGDGLGMARRSPTTSIRPSRGLTGSRAIAPPQFRDPARGVDGV